MAGQLMKSSTFTGTALNAKLRTSRTSKPARLNLVAAVRKVNTFDSAWEKGLGSVGYFAESNESSLTSKSYLKKIEEKKILSGVEKLGLLSKLEKAGLTLSKVEQLGLLSTAEKFGLLSVAEDVLVEDPAKIVSFSIPFFVSSILALCLIPGDNTAELVLKYVVATGLGGVAATIFVAGFVIAAIQEE